MKIKSTLTMALAISLTAGVFTACKKEKGCTDPTATNYNSDAEEDDGSCTYETEATKSGTLSADEHWTADKIYFLNGRVIVPSGVTLTIDPGTIIKGIQGQDANASALIIARGGKIMAEGNATNPIIFTSELDDIAIGEKNGGNLARTDNEKWGGIIILGKAPISAESGDTESSIEGLPPNEDYAKYGGSSENDNSGILKYVSIRHGGISIGEGNEINGLTLGGVGNGTTIDNIEIYATLDDGVEFFGGSVNASNILVYYQGDDGIDVDQSYSGTVSNFAVIHGDGIGTDEALEIDGPENTSNTGGMFHLMNGFCKRDGSEGTPGDFKSKAQGKVHNITFQYGSDNIKIRASYQNACADAKTDAFTHLTDSPATLEFDNCSFSGVEVYTASDDGATPPTDCTVPGADQTAAEGVVNGGGSGGTVNPATDFSWTLAGSKGEL